MQQGLPVNLLSRLKSGSNPVAPSITCRERRVTGDGSEVEEQQQEQHGDQEGAAPPDPAEEPGEEDQVDGAGRSSQTQEVGRGLFIQGIFGFQDWF